MNPVNVHPGEAIQEFLEDYNLSQSQLARELRVPVRRINTIVRGERSITADTAVRLARFFGNRADFWLGLQELYDINETEQQLAPELMKIHPVSA
ncbi:MAG: HigA family addiction module antidote protein [Kiritimatiellales bacterium]|nr:HigA family addiction module antidote protein [Kiritimatiellales bacterium]